MELKSRIAWLLKHLWYSSSCCSKLRGGPCFYADPKVSILFIGLEHQKYESSEQLLCTTFWFMTIEREILVARVEGK